MARNVEVKVPLENRAHVEKLLAAMACEGPTSLRQRDIFFRCPRGRLKLRSFATGRAELIQYSRPDEASTRLSTYHRVPVEHPDDLERALTLSLGVKGEVLKRRTLYLVGRTRVHLDEVEDLGDWLELEVCLEKDNDDIEAGHREARAMLERFGIDEKLIEGRAYVDLLTERH